MESINESRMPCCGSIKELIESGASLPQEPPPTLRNSYPAEATGDSQKHERLGKLTILFSGFRAEENAEAQRAAKETGYELGSLELGKRKASIGSSTSDILSNLLQYS